MPTYLIITIKQKQSFYWNGYFNGEQVNSKSSAKQLSKIAIGALKPVTKELIIDDVMVGGFSIRTPKYGITVNHTEVVNSDKFFASIEGRCLSVEGVLVIKVSLKDDALADLKNNITKSHLSTFSIWNPESNSKKNYYDFTKTGIWENDKAIEKEIFSGAEFPERSIFIEISTTKPKLK